jgi:drug/metabolite transporter (DMT)-like permease
MAIAATLSFSFAPSLNKVGIALGVNPSTLLVVRMWLATLLLVGSIRIKRAESLKLDRRGLAFSCLAGILHGVAMLCFNWSLTRISASVATMCFSVHPSVALVLLATRGERLTRRRMTRLALGIGGTYLLIGPGGQVEFTGLILVFAAVLAFSLFLVISQWFLAPYDLLLITMYTVGMMAITATAVWLVQGVEWHPLGWRSWLVILCLALVVSFLGQTLYLGAIKRIGSGQVALLMPVETLLAIIWSVLLLKEKLTVLQWLGGALILLSTLLVRRRSSSRRWRLWRS